MSDHPVFTDPGHEDASPDAEIIWEYDFTTKTGGIKSGWAWRYGEFNEERGYRDIVFYRVEP
jgi:hypothetical protein